jgi:hypothetical protein
MTKPDRYCGPCDKYVPAHWWECKTCGADTDKVPPMTRQERLEALADRGVDTWEECRNER